MLKHRKQIMREVRSRIVHRTRELVGPLDMDAVVKEEFFELFEKKIKECGIRSLFVHILYRYIAELAEKEGIELNKINEELFETDLPLIAEGIITVQYLENQIIDGKDGTKGDGKLAEKRRNNKLVSSHFLKDFLYEFIDENLFLEDHERQAMLRKAVRRSFQCVDIAQKYQMKYGTFNRLKNDYKSHVDIPVHFQSCYDSEIINDLYGIISSKLNIRNGEFLRNYLVRVLLSSASMFVLLAEMEMDLLGYFGKERKNILKFSGVIGILGQIVNDICDFTAVNTVSKGEDDNYADIKNNIITLPLNLHLNNNMYNSIKTLANNIEKSEIFYDIIPDIRNTMTLASKIRDYCKNFIRLDTCAGIIIEDMNSVQEPHENSYLKQLNIKIFKIKNSLHTNPLMSLHY